MTILQQLVQGCGASVEIEINRHINECMTVREYLSSPENKTQIMPPEQMIQSMEQADSVVGITFYPLTPVSYEQVWHFDVEIGLIVALTKFLRIKGGDGK